MPQSKRDRFNELMKERDDKAGKLQNRPEYPLNFDKPLALVAIRIKVHAAGAGRDVSSKVTLPERPRVRRALVDLRWHAGGLLSDHVQVRRSARGGEHAGIRREARVSDDCRAICPASVHIVPTRAGNCRSASKTTG
jgi:hypothetical protein